MFTFGSAPVTSQSVTKLAAEQPNVGSMLAIVNENDMVTRADGHYLRSIVNLYRAGYGLPPTPADGRGSPEKSAVANLAIHANVSSRGLWPLPSPMYHLVGDIIVLWQSTDSPSVDPGDVDVQDEETAGRFEYNSKLRVSSAQSHERVLLFGLQRTLIRT